MTAFVLVFSPVFTALFGVLLAAIVALRPPGLPLSVRVPQSHANDPVVRRAIRSFRWGLALAWVLTAILTLVLAIVDLTPLATVLPVLLYAALSMVVLVLSRRTIIRAKREGDWFEGVPVRVSAQLTPVAYHHPPFVWPALAAIVLAAATAVNVALYPTLPDPFPVHYDVSGQPDGWAAKSVWSVFGVLIIGAAVVILLTVLSLVAARYTARIQSDDTAEQSALRTRVQRGMLTSLLSQLSFVIALGISGIVLVQRLLPGGSGAIAGVAIAMVVLIMLVVILAVVRGRAQLRPANVRDASAPRPDAVDDDSHWKGGLFYVNRADPALVVPRRFGLGWTLNLGRPGGVALTVLLLLVIAGVVTTVILTAHGG
ncbi:MAG: hypothetical protein JWN36_2911 [Microbacteriaceae bacterium]|nr:hypothetical protein [Microbacteriaceae bacterium]